MAGTWTRRQKLLDSNHEVKVTDDNDKIGVYKLYITDDIPYPKKRGRVIYIGKSEKSMYKRLNEHWEKGTNEGVSNYINYFDVKLSVRVARTKNQALKWEKKEIEEHIETYGAYPVCNRKKGTDVRKGKKQYIHAKCNKCDKRRARRKDNKCPCTYGK